MVFQFCCRLVSPEFQALMQYVPGGKQKLAFLWSSWVLLMLPVQKSCFMNFGALRSSSLIFEVLKKPFKKTWSKMSNILVVERKLLTKTPKFLSVPLWGTIPHSPNSACSAQLIFRGRRPPPSGILNSHNLELSPSSTPP